MSKEMGRSKAFFINGGAGRVLCSIPAFEKYEEESGDEDFIIVCEGGMELYKGHPTLHKRAYDNWHKGLFENFLKERDMISPEPYRVWDYYNQKASLAQAFDIEINKQSKARPLNNPTISLSKEELVQGYQVVQEIKAMTKKDKVLVIQPFGRSVQQEGSLTYDTSSRSFELNNITDLIESLRKKYAIIIMADISFPISANDEHPVAQPEIPDMRIWASVISASTHFLGCDSVGQHIVKALGKTATVVVGSTYPENISYPNDKDFDIFDIGKDTRTYSPIRATIEDVPDRMNEKCMTFNDTDAVDIIKSVVKRLGKPVKFEGEFIPKEHNAQTCTNPNHNHGPVLEPIPGKREDQAFAYKKGGKKQTQGKK
jgi:ADP-heptose:LPS heptosyltransferase